MKLSGIRVLDFSRFMAGPLISSIMADHGADVVKVEGPDGDPTRAGRRTRATQNAGDSFSALNRGKRSIVLDLKQPEDRHAALELIRDADVLIESFSPGVTARLGIDADVVRQLNPRIVYCSISAFGQSGPLRDAAGHDPAVQALAGILPIDRNGAPVIPAVSIASWCSAHSALAGILMALIAARSSGLGDHIDISMHDVALSTRPNALFNALAESAGAPDVTLGYAMLEPYETEDGGWLCLGAGEPRFARALLTALERPDLVTVALDKPGAAQDPLRVFLAEEFRRKPLAAWLEWLAAHAVSAVPVLRYAEAMRHEHVSARGMLLADPHGNLHLDTPIRFEREPGKPNLHVPALGEHTAEIRAAAGLS
ncbi:CaiB/BaiF CoA-transferase family protein [Paraburkholderia fungorum]|uniref:CaiB/BaiF CoA transferase family protein n=1 Tax=Paraburkholderia fungorum TaxID=134537 RepID=UPI0038BDF61F